jgi:hypothetical protein
VEGDCRDKRSAGLAMLGFVFEFPIQGVVATSGIIAIVLGLALQSTLSDVHSQGSQCNPTVRLTVSRERVTKLDRPYLESTWGMAAVAGTR